MHLPRRQVSEEIHSILVGLVGDSGNDFGCDEERFRDAEQLLEAPILDQVIL